MWSAIALPPTGGVLQARVWLASTGAQCCWLQALPLVQPAALPGALTCRAGAQRLPLMLGVRGELLSMKSEGLEVVFEACRAAAALCFAWLNGSGRKSGPQRLLA